MSAAGIVGSLDASHTACKVCAARSGGLPAVRSEAPERIVAILKSATSPVPDPRLTEVLEAFRSQWRAIARRKYPSLQAEIEDAIQNALLKLLSAEKLETLRDAARLDAWARSLFVHAALDLVCDKRRELIRRSLVGRPGDDPEEILRDRLPSATPTPEELVAARERLQIVARCVEGLEVARLRFVEGLAEKDIAVRRGLTRDGVAGQLKRFRKALRRALGEPEGSA